MHEGSSAGLGPRHSVVMRAKGSVVRLPSKVAVRLKDEACVRAMVTDAGTLCRMDLWPRHAHGHQMGDFLARRMQEQGTVTACAPS